MNRKHYLTAAFLLCANLTFGQEQANKTWSLQDCMDYAAEHNIQLQKSKLTEQLGELDLIQKKAELFPSLSFSTTQTLTYRPLQESASNIVTDGIANSSTNKLTENGSYGLNASWNVWDGGINRKNIKNQRIQNQINQLNTQTTANSIQEQIAQLFIQILYADESIRINKGTLEVSEATYQRGKELFNEGSISKADLAQLEAQVSNDKYQVVSAESSLRNYKLQLKQLLELDGTEEMDLILPQLDNEDVMKLLPSQTDIYQTALAIRPEIQSGRLSIENAKLGISAAKSGYYPTISLSASSSSTTNSASTNNWAQQMKYGWNNMIGINLSIPIFDNRQNKSNVQKAKLQYNTSQLELVNKQKELYSTIESLWLDALNAQQQYAAAETKVKSSQTSFDMVSEQFNLGMKNTVELLTEKNNLLSAKQELVQAKYMAILNRTLLNFYAGNNIEL